MYRLTCTRVGDDKVYDKQFEAEADLLEYLESELASDASDSDSYAYTIYRQQWVVLPWKQKVELL